MLNNYNKASQRLGKIKIIYLDLQTLESDFIFYLGLSEYLSWNPCPSRESEETWSRNPDHQVNLPLRWKRDVEVKKTVILQRVCQLHGRNSIAWKLLWPRANTRNISQHTLYSVQHISTSTLRSLIHCTFCMKINFISQTSDRNCFCHSAWPPGLSKC